MKHPALIAVALSAALVSSAAAQTVSSRTVDFRIHEVPSDPDSPTVFIVTLHLQPFSVYTEKGRPGGSVDWTVTEIELFQVLENGDEKDWFEENPFVDTSTGRWRTTHDDIEHLEDGEFGTPPALDGVGESRDGSEPDLVYAFEGVEPLTGPVYETTAFIDLLATKDGEQEPTQEDDDEPVEVDSFEDPN